MTQINNVETSEKQDGNNRRIVTSVLLIGILFPLLFLACVIPLFATTKSWSGIDIFADIYLSLFLLTLLFILFYAIYEATNFIFPRNENSRVNLILIISLSIILSIPFLFQSFYLLGIMNNSSKLNIAFYIGILLIGLIIFFVITSVMNIDFRDVLTLMFMTVIFYLFISTLAHNVIINGWQIVMLILGITIVSDTTAYFGGKKYGNKKIFPDISPNKTVEGFVIGLMSSITFGILFFIAFFTWDSGFINGEISQLSDSSSMWLILLITVFISVISPFGDLTFSKIKRSYGKKDFSNILPGHGGLFDRVDSHIFTMTTATLLIMILF